MRSLERRNLGAVAAADPRQQLMDIEGLIARRLDVVIILAQDSAAIVPALEQARA